MPKKTAEKFGFTIDNRAESAAAGKNKTKRIVRGSVGAGSIKVPDGQTKDGKKKYVSIPIPSGVTLSEIKTFLGKAKTKPEGFVSKQGRYYPLSDGKK
jgi:hypothetical protein